MFGMTNVPFGVWIDESGTIVRPAEVGFAPRPEPVAGSGAPRPAAANVDPRSAELIKTITSTTGDRTRYMTAVRDWVANGGRSSYVLAPDEVVRRSRPQPPEAALAAAEFELGQHLHRIGYPLDAVPHFKRAHELDPENWSYPRQALSLVDPEVGQNYGYDVLDEVARIGPTTFYPPLEM